MKVPNKKYLAVMLCSIFLVSIFTPAATADVENENDSLRTAIEKYDELMENYDEIENYFGSIVDNFNFSNISIYEDVTVVSWGKGFHFKSKWYFKFTFVNRLIAYLLKINRPRINRPFLYFNHNNLSKGSTLILKANNINETVKINGTHLVLMTSFRGVTNWFRRFDLSPFDIIPKVVIGKANYMVTYKY